MRAPLFYGIAERPVPTERFGQGNGAWNVAAGSLRASSVVLSAGVGQDISFDLDIARQHGCRVLMLDPSPTGTATIERLQPLPPKLSFEPIGLAGKDGPVAFAAPCHEAEGSFRVRGGKDDEDGHVFPCERLSTFMARHNVESLDLLKLDIEGFEYGVLADTLASNCKVRQICVEFHHGVVPGVTRWQTLRTILLLRLHGYVLINHDGLNHTFLKQR